SSTKRRGDSYCPSRLRDDDVFTKDFKTNVVILQRKKNASSGRPQIDLVQYVSQNRSVPCKGEQWLLTFQIIIENHELPPGPYFLTPDNFLAEAWRLYPDTQDAFATTFVPPSEPGISGFRPLVGVDGDGIWRPVAVPSRLYTAKADKNRQPLAGLRVSVKDNFKVAGVKTTQNNRAFVELYPPDQESAHFIKVLQSLGVVVVGKTKMCAFASSEEATDQWIDFHGPFNPRADGYQSPSGSTTGGAVGLAAYDWLDFSVGTDTTGSIRWPAAWNGLFGMRISWGVETLKGVWPSCGFVSLKSTIGAHRVMDTLGLLSRDINLLRDLMTASVPTLKVCPAVSKCAPNAVARRPKKVLYPTDFFPHDNPHQQALIDKWMKTLELMGFERTNFSIAERWNQCPPPEANGKSIREYLNK
ncbi:amidase signature domain-containing protein, partial [Diplogelasinospora grovesii]